MTNPTLNIAVTFTIAIVVLYCLVLWLTWRFQEKLLFFPGGASFPACEGIDELNGIVIDVNHENQRIRGFYFPKPNANSTIFLFHGNGGNACDRINYVQGLQDTNVNIFLVEYPGYAGSSEEMSEDSFLQNAEAAVRWWKSVNAPTHDLLFFGESMGAGVVSHLASIFEAKLLILHTPYDSISNVAKHHYPWLPVKSLIRHSFNSVAKLEKNSAPVMILHGDNDKTIPIAHAEALYKSIPTGVEKRFERFPRRGHNDLWISNASYWNSLEEEIKKRIENP